MNKIVMIALPLILIGGGIVGAGMAGVVNIPGLTPKKAKPAATEEPLPEEDAAPPADEPAPLPDLPKPPPSAEPPKPTTDPERGTKKVAALWTEIDTTKLQGIVADWKEPELAAILRKMDPGKVAELLAAMDSKKASTLSREIQKQASAL